MLKTNARRKTSLIRVVAHCITAALLCGLVTLQLGNGASSFAATTAAAEFDITHYGAVGDGKTLNTQAFAAAINACATAGGGRVTIPAGTYLTGPIVLKSHIDLHVDAGAVVLFITRFEDYPLVRSNYEGWDTYMCQSPLSGDHVEDISITGPGAFDAQGDRWRPLKKTKCSIEHWNDMVKSGGVVNKDGTFWYPSPEARDGEPALKVLRESHKLSNPADFLRFRQLLRPCLLMLSNCTDITLDGATFKNSPNWNLHLLLCDRVKVQHLNIWNPDYAQNGDGIDMDACRNVQMSDCTVYAGDDGICLKSGKDEEGRRRGMPTENITIDNCTVGYAHGGFVIGSEMSGGVRNVTCTHCTFIGTQTGLRFKSTRGRGGVVENIHVSDIKMTNITEAAITFDMFYTHSSPTTQPITDGTPIFRNFQISNVECQGAGSAILFRGLPEMPIGKIDMDHVHITADHGVSITDAADITLRDVKVECTASPALIMQNVSSLITDGFTCQLQPTPSPHVPMGRGPG